MWHLSSFARFCGVITSKGSLEQTPLGFLLMSVGLQAWRADINLPISKGFLSNKKTGE